MPVIIEDCEAMLLGHMDCLKDDTALWGMALLQGAQLDIACQHMLLSTEAQIYMRNMSIQMELFFYLYRDGDVAILFQGERSNVWPALRTMFYELLPHLDAADIECSSLFIFFDLHSQYALAYRWAQSKQQKHLEPALEPVAGDNGWDQETFLKARYKRKLREKKLIAVTEDNRTQRQLAHIILRNDYDVVLAYHGLEALQIYNQHAPDLMFLDIQMPHVDGIDILKQLIIHDPQARIVVFSTRSNEAMLQLAMAYGAKGVFTKPFTADALMRYARKTLAEAA